MFDDDEGESKMKMRNSTQNGLNTVYSISIREDENNKRLDEKYLERSSSEKSYAILEDEKR